MIKINLLGVPRPKRGKRAAAAPSMGGGEGIHPIVIFLVLLVVTVGALGFWYYKLTNDAASLKQRYDAAQRKKNELAVLQAKLSEKEKQRDAFKVRADVISELEGKRSGPVNLLTMISDTVNQTDAVWLDSVTEDTGNINIKGQAVDIHAVANLIGNLKKTNYFANVELKETSQDSKDLQAFSFTLQCQKKS